MTTIWPLLLEALHPRDCPPPDGWRTCYETKFALARLLKPRSILEIGVRAGYSALAFLTAVPDARYLGLDANTDTHGGFHGAIDHARRLLAPFEAEVREQTSAEFATTPAQSVGPFDLIHVDGDHSLAGCTFDLALARRVGCRHLLVDDYTGIVDVRTACDRFAREHASEWTRVVLDDGHHGAVLFSS